MTSFQTADLESGPARAGLIEARPPLSGVNASSQTKRSLGTRALVESRPQPGPEPRTRDRPKDKDVFVEDAGQSLLLVFGSHKNQEASAILIPVFRPSVEWARSMETKEKDAPDTLPVKAPEKTMRNIERWRQFRWLHRGEDEVEIWDRVKKRCLAQQPRWCSFLPFWRPVLLEERNLLLRSREGSICTVEIEPAIDLQEKRKKADRKFRQANKDLEGYMPDEYNCHGEFDAFGEFFSEYHDAPPCRKGIRIDDYNEHSCDIEIFIRRRSERDRLERGYEFMNCFNDPNKASAVYPLTSGRVFDSCIHDNGTFRNCASREHPNRLPPRINGLVIEYHFSSTQIEFGFFSSALFVGVVVLVWRFATGDWNVAVAFGSLCVALMALGHQRSRKADGTMVKNTKID